MPQGKVGESGLGEGGTVNPGSLGGNKCRGQGGLTGEVAVQADGDIVKSHGGSGSLSPPCDNLQPEPVHVLRGVCVRNSLGWPHLRTQRPANGCRDPAHDHCSSAFPVSEQLSEEAVNISLYFSSTMHCPLRRTVPHVNPIWSLGLGSRTPGTSRRAFTFWVCRVGRHG